MDISQLCRKLIEQAPDAVIFAHPTGIIQIWNSGAEAVFGYSISEALGQSLDLIVPEDLRKAHWQGFDLAIQAGHTKLARTILTTRAIHKNGGKIYINFTFSIILDQLGQVLGALALGREFTSRYLEEKSLRKKVAELERKLKASSHD